jgi:fructose-bisphosphate aldolase class 1
MKAQAFIDIVRTLVAGDNGLLAMDERNPTCNKRFARLEIWQGEEARVLAAQQALVHRAGCNSAERRGEYNTTMERT